MRVMIHSCPRRMWYVERFLVPSLEAQGISGENLIIWNDIQKAGNQQSWVESCAFLGAFPGGTWHLQDDVVICRDFAERCDKLDSGVVAGFCNEKFGPNVRLTGERPATLLFNSFQCIRIPNDYAAAHAEWYWSDARKRHSLQEWVLTGKRDDQFFHLWMEETHPDDTVLNLKPCLVDHIDWLIGGSVINYTREGTSRAYYWEDEQLIRELAAALGRSKGLQI